MELRSANITSFCIFVPSSLSSGVTVFEEQTMSVEKQYKHGMGVVEYWWGKTQGLRDVYMFKWDDKSTTLLWNKLPSNSLR